MSRRFNALDMVRDIEIHKRIHVADWPKEWLAEVKAVWDERNPAHELVFNGTMKKNFTGFMEWREK